MRGVGHVSCTWQPFKHHTPWWLGGQALGERAQCSLTAFTLLPQNLHGEHTCWAPRPDHRDPHGLGAAEVKHSKTHTERTDHTASTPPLTLRAAFPGAVAVCSGPPGLPRGAASPCTEPAGSGSAMLVNE